MIIEISKKLIIEAIAGERLDLLRPGYWFGDEATTKDCPRCAVGSVINTIVDAKTAPNAITEIAHDSVIGFPYTPRGSADDNDDYEANILDNALETLEDHNSKPMAALSYYFEGRCEVRKLEHQERGGWSENESDEYTDAMIEEARADTISFVKEHFPETVKIDINGYEPAKDVA